MRLKSPKEEKLFSENYRKISYRIGTDFDIKVNALKARLFDNEGFNAERQLNEFVKRAENIARIRSDFTIFMVIILILRYYLSG